jgi:GNAT superfamily N-acetyltransferase
VAVFDFGNGRSGVIRDLVAEPDSVLLEKVYRRVLSPAFQPDEVESLEEISAQVADGSILRMLAVFDAGGEPIAVITADWYSRGRVLLIGYLAVREDLRGQGIGTSLIYQAVLKWITDLKPVLGVAEVEDPRYFTVSSTGDPEARLRLYGRLGGRILGVPYFQPKLDEGSQRVHHLMLMAFVADSMLITETAAESVPAEPIGIFLEDYFEAAEGPQALDDPEFLELKKAVLSLGTVPLLHASELDRLPAL